MSKIIVQKDELASLILAEVRKHDGCGGVDRIVVLETRSPRSVTNWEIGIVVASENLTAVKAALTAVQERLQMKYGLG
jgi:hypothetical protein